MPDAGNVRITVNRSLVDAVTSLSVGHPVRVGIDGRSAAGWTTFADDLAQEVRIRGREVIRASIDDFHRPGHRDRSLRRGWTPQSYYDAGYDYGAFVELLLRPPGPGGNRRCRTALFDASEDDRFLRSGTRRPLRRSRSWTAPFCYGLSSPAAGNTSSGAPSIWKPWSTERGDVTSPGLGRRSLSSSATAGIGLPRTRSTSGSWILSDGLTPSSTIETQRSLSSRGYLGPERALVRPDSLVRHVNHTLTKTGTANRGEAAACAHRHRLIQRPN